jgi:hypothetical protein
MVAIIQTKTAPGGAPRPIARSGNVGEMHFSVPGFVASGPGAADSLWIDNGSPNLVPLVDNARQVELTGTQTITGPKTVTSPGSIFFTDIATLQFGDGVAGESLQKGPGSSVVWGPGGGAATVVTDGVTIAGDGTAGNPVALLTAIFGGVGLTWTAGTHILSVTQATQTIFGGALIATTALINVGANDVTIVSPLGLRGQLGAPANTLTTIAQTVVPAINELKNNVDALSGVLILVGTYDAATNVVTPSRLIGAGPLPPAAPGNEGWYVIVTTAGTGTGNAPAVPMAVGDWLVSNGVNWIWLDLVMTATVATNVAVVPPVAGQNNVQNALTTINGLAQSALQNVFFNATTFSGNALTAGTALDIAVVDGGLF